MNVWGKKVGVAGGHIGLYILSFFHFFLKSTGLILEAEQLSCDAKGDENMLRMAGGKTQGAHVSPGIMEPLYPFWISDFWTFHSVRKKENLQFA